MEGAELSTGKREVNGRVSEGRRGYSCDPAWAAEATHRGGHRTTAGVPTGPVRRHGTGSAGERGYTGGGTCGGRSTPCGLVGLVAGLGPRLLGWGLLVGMGRPGGRIGKGGPIPLKKGNHRPPPPPREEAEKPSIVRMRPAAAKPKHVGCCVRVSSVAQVVNRKLRKPLKNQMCCNSLAEVDH